MRLDVAPQAMFQGTQGIVTIGGVHIHGQRVWRFSNIVHGHSIPKDEHKGNSGYDHLK
jgi:hypothetical protein